MEVFLLSLAIMLLAFVGMAAGVLLRRRGIEGSCGGIGRFKEMACWFCPNRKDGQCKEDEDGA